MADYYCTAGRGTEPFVAAELFAIDGVKNVKETDGKVYFSAEDSAIPQLLHLRSVERLFIAVKNLSDFRLRRKKDVEDLGIALANTVEWETISSKFQLFRDCINKDGEEEVPAKRRKLDESQTRESGKALTFRISCKLAGNLFVMFDSSAVSKSLASHIVKKLNWRVDLRTPLMDVCVHIGRSGATVGIPVTKSPLSLRPYLTSFGLRSTVAWIMSKLANIKPGDIVLDPMCGVATILLEACHNWPEAHYIGMDSSADQVKRALSNTETKARTPIHLLCGDATNLPMRTASVDALVCDMPFGNKYLSEEKVKNLIPSALKEFHRVLKPNSTAVLLMGASLKEELVSEASKMVSSETDKAPSQEQINTVPPSAEDSINCSEDPKHSTETTSSNSEEDNDEHMPDHERCGKTQSSANSSWESKGTHYLKLGETHAYACVLVRK